MPPCGLAHHSLDLTDRPKESAACVLAKHQIAVISVCICRQNERFLGRSDTHKSHFTASRRSHLVRMMSRVVLLERLEEQPSSRSTRCPRAILSETVGGLPRKSRADAEKSAHQSDESEGRNRDRRIETLSQSRSNRRRERREAQPPFGGLTLRSISATRMWEARSFRRSSAVGQPGRSAEAWCRSSSPTVKASAAVICDFCSAHRCRFD
jgi:hypothetical protein